MYRGGFERVGHWGVNLAAVLRLAFAGRRVHRCAGGGHGHSDRVNPALAALFRCGRCLATVQGAARFRSSSAFSGVVSESQWCVAALGLDAFAARGVAGSLRSPRSRRRPGVRWASLALALGPGRVLGAARWGPGRCHLPRAGLGGRGGCAGCDHRERSLRSPRSPRALAVAFVAAWVGVVTTAVRCALPG